MNNQRPFQSQEPKKLIRPIFTHTKSQQQRNSKLDKGRETEPNIECGFWNGIRRNEEFYLSSGTEPRQNEQKMSNSSTNNLENSNKKR